MEKKDIEQMLRDFRTDFLLTYADLALIVKSEEVLREGAPKEETLKLEKKARGMDKIRRELKEITDDKSELNKLLLAYNKKLKMSYFYAMREGGFKEVLADIRAFKKRQRYLNPALFFLFV